MCASSVWSERRNFLRAGTLKNRSRTVMVVPGARATSSRAQHFAARHFDSRARSFLRGARFEQKPRHRSDGGQRLAAKTERRDGEQVFHIAQLAGGVALESQHGIVAQHPAAVIGNPNQSPAAVFDFDTKRFSARVQRIFEQLLDHRRWPLHDLARGDLVGNLVGKNADTAHRGRC